MIASPLWSILIGFDQREAPAFVVARESIRRFNRFIPVNGVVLDHVRAAGLYTRETERRLGRLYDVPSRAPDYDGSMSTEFAISRFLTPHLAKGGLALFMDCDMLVRVNLTEMFRSFDRSKALMCVKHEHAPLQQTTKMDGQAQTVYPRKNWSSLMLFNCDHPSTQKLTLEMINTRPGRDLHALCWLDDDEIGELGPEWNWLVGHSDPKIEPKIVHFTDGPPTMEGFRNVAYADEFFDVLNTWANRCA